MKWSRNYKYCIKCYTNTNKHKWNWLCTSCFDKNRYKNNEKRRIQNKIRWTKFHFNVRILQYLFKKKHKKTWPDIIRDKKINSLYAKIWYWLKKWKNLIQININWNYNYLPFEEIYDKKNVKYKKQQEEYKKMLIYYYKKYENK